MNTNAAARDRLVARRSTVLRRRLLPVLIAGCFTGAALANPLGPQVVNGQVSFNNQGNVLSVTNTPGSIINWQSFSINPGELTRFIQQNPNSAVLNRIIGQDPSQILGALQSNGRVFLINPNGILFGQGAQVDVNGLVASTLNISNEDFLTGKLNFKAGDKAGSLKNQGAITTPAGGQVYLIASNVENSGIVTSPKGEVLLAAGRSVQLVDSMNPDLHVVVSAPEDEALNLGQVIAQGGKTGIYGALVTQRGIVSANSAVVGEDGKVVFKASRDVELAAGSRTSASGARGGEINIHSPDGATRVAGTVEAIGTQENGGEIRLLGKEVSLVDNASIDVSGKRGGGTVLAGGDYQGSNPLVQNAMTAYMGSDTSIKADASDDGDGGKVILWSDGSTTAHGSISARGGALSGRGGLIETSGHTIDFSQVRVNTRAGKGPFGLWLIDPQDLVIDATGAGNIVSNITGSDITLTTAACNTTYGTCGPGTSGNITVSSPITMINAGGRKLALVADNNIVINSAIGDSGMGTHVDLQASGAITLNSNISLTGTLKATASGGLTQPGGIITANSLELLGSGNFSLGNANSIGTVAANISGDLALQTSGAVSVGTVGATNGITAAGNITLTAGGAANINNTVSATTGGTVNLTGTAVSLSSPGGISAGTGTVNVTATAAGGLINVGASTQMTVTGTGQINLKSDDLTLAGTLDAGGPNGSGKVNISSYNASRVIDIGTDNSTNRLGLTSTELNKVSANELVIGGGSNTGGIDVTNDVTMANTSVKKFGLETTGNISTSDVNKRIITDNGSVTLKANGTGDISIGGVRTAGGSVDAVAGGMIVLREVLTTPVIGAGGNVVLNAGGLLTVNDVDARPGSAFPYGDVTLTSGAGISVSNANKIYADDLKMTAVSGIHGSGATDYANVQASTLNAKNTGSGDIRVSNGGTDLTINNGGVIGANGIDAASGTVDIKNATGYKISIQAPVVTQGAPLKITAPKGIDFVAYVSGTNSGGLVASNGGNIDLLSTDSDALINMPAGASVASANGAVTLLADNMGFTGSSIAAGSGSVLLAPYNSAAGIKLGAGATDAPATLGLTDSELGTISTSTNLQIGSVIAVPSGTVDVVGALNLVTPGKLSGGFEVYSASGAINVNGPITAPATATLWTGSGTLTNNAAITAANTALNASKMVLAGGTISSPSGYVQLSGGSNAFHLGTVTTDLTASTVELSNAELNTISTNKMRVGTLSSGPITIKSTLSTGFSAMRLYSGGAITQDVGALLGGATSFNLKGASVTLTEANPTGVIAGAAMAGDFKYHSLNGIHVSSVDDGTGITVPGANNIFLESDFVGPSGVIQTSPIIGGGLAVKAIGGVMLDNSSNSISKVAADLSLDGTGTGSFSLRNSGALSVDTVLTISGITTKDKDITVKSDSGAITVNQAVGAAASTVALAGDVALAGTGLSIANSVTGNDISLEGDSLSLGATIAGAAASIHPRTSALPITVGAACGGCLSVTNLHKMDVPAIGIGKTASTLPGAITVAGISVGGTGLTDRHANTTRIGLLTGSTVSQTPGTTINVHDLGINAGGTVNLSEANSVVNLAGLTTSGTFTFNNAGSFYVSTMTGGSAADGNSYSLGGVMTAGGNILLASSTGDITLDPSSPISAVTGNVTLSAGLGAISGPASSVIVGGMLNASAANGIALKTMVSTLAANNNGLTGDISIVNYAPLSLYDILQSNSGASTGSIAITNTGAVSQPSGKSVSAKGGSINILAQSPLTLGGSVTTTSGAITLEAGTGSNPNDILTISGTVSSGTGNITLKAGDGITGTATTGGTLTVQANRNTAISSGGGTTAPTVDQCTANPSLSGCSTVLPTLGSCTADPTLAGCTAVLPTLSSCTTNPSQDGCTAVLPTLNSCTTNPGQEGCAVVLPTLGSCTTDPSQNGCTAVLPTLDSCATTPTLAGCSAVLPTVSACTTTPSLTGCTAVLPTLGDCAATPALAGCSAVLPPLTSCTATPTLAGCTAVLPTLGDCTATPALAGCSAVLPPLTSCTATPTLAGCTAVLPTVSACTTTPSLAGCSAVLPTLSSCTTAPTQAGCAAVLPPVSACTATPTLEGCSAVLPSLSQCSATPTLEGCSVIVPIASKCTVNPSAPDCATVLPAASTATKETFTETVNDTVDTIVIATTTSQSNTVTAQASGGASSGSSPSASKAASKSADKGEDKKDEKKDEKKTTAGPDDSGAKKNEAAKKMYCN